MLLKWSSILTFKTTNEKFLIITFYGLKHLPTLACYGTIERILIQN
jgi:hypothetical protein